MLALVSIVVYDVLMDRQQIDKSSTQQTHNQPSVASQPTPQPTSEAARVLQMQRRYGNQAVRRMLASADLQRQSPTADAPATDRTVEFPIAEATSPPHITTIPLGLGTLIMSTTATAKGSVSLTEKGQDSSGETKLDGATGQASAKKEFGDAMNKLSFEMTGSGMSVTVGGDAYPMDTQIEGNAVIFKPKPIKVESDKPEYKAVTQIEISFKIEFSGTFSGYAVEALLFALGVAAASKAVMAALGAIAKSMAEFAQFGFSRTINAIMPIIIILPPDMMEPGRGGPPPMA